MPSFVERNSSQWDEVHKILNIQQGKDTGDCQWLREAYMTECPRLATVGYAWYLPFLPWPSKCLCGGRGMHVFMHAHARGQTQLLFCRSYLPHPFYWDTVRISHWVLGFTSKTGLEGSLVLGLQAHTSSPGIFKSVLEIELRVSCWHDKHFTN